MKSLDQIIDDCKVDHCCGAGEGGCQGPVERRRQNTAYEDDESNWTTACEYHFEVIQAGWKERWDEYNSGRF